MSALRAVEYYLDREPKAFAKDGKVHVSTGLSARLETDELVGIILHETAHIEREHSLRKFLVSLVACLLILSMGFIELAPSWVRVLLILSVLALSYWLLGRINHWCEFDADAYVVKQGYGRPLAEALCKLSPRPHEESFSHPAIMDRVLRIYEKA
jgi:Zn-dependent protease with chaperone function